MSQDIEYGNYYNNDRLPLNGKFSDSLNLRLGFVRKVYGILCFQLLLTTLICVISMVSDSFARFQFENYGLMIATCVLSFVIMIAIVCFKSVARTVPTNYICLIIFTLCEAYMISFICASVGEPKIVVIAAAMTLGMTLSLTVYACVTKKDFTYLGGTLFILATALIMFGIFMGIFHAWNKPLYVMYCAFGVILYGYYLIYDTQLIMGGKRHELELDDYVIGAIIIYLDVIIIFLKLLEILSILFGKK